MKRGQIGLGVLGAVLAFAVAGPVAAIIVAWLLVSPDAAASTARGGGAGAIGAAAKAAGGYLAEEWRAGGPARRQRRSARRQRWSEAGGWRARLLAVEHVLVLAGRGLRSVVVAAAVAGAVIPAGARAGADAARREYRARKGRPDPAADPAAVDAGDQKPTTAANDSTGGRDRSGVVHEDCLDYMGEAMGATCPRCGTPWQPITVTHDDGSTQTRMSCPTCQAWRTAHDSEARTDDPRTRVPAGDSNTPDSGGRTATGQAPPPPQPTGDGMPQTDTTAAVGSSELATTDDLRAECGVIAGLLEEAAVLGGLLKDWQTALPDAYEGGHDNGGPKTKALDEAVDAVSEASEDGQALGEALGGIRQACDQADSLGEHAAAMGADGHTTGYVSA